MERYGTPVLCSLLTLLMPAFPPLMTYSGKGCALVRIIEDIFASQVAVLLVAVLMLVIFGSILFVGGHLKRPLGVVFLAFGLLVNSVVMAHWIIFLFGLRDSCI